MLMSNRRKMAQNCWIFGAARGSDEEAGKRDKETKSQRDKERKSQGVKERKRRRDEARHHLLPFPVLRSLRS